MSDHLVSSDEGKDKSHLCIQTRQDQVHPSENSEISPLEGEDDNHHRIGNLIESSSRVPNGDQSLGSWRGIPLHGTGRNLLSDGCIYEGEWEDGKLSGRGKITWPSGATYEGDFWGGYMHGVGSYIGANGVTYKGDWRMNIKHGLGRKLYANGDVYQGSWNQGKQEGPGRYVWVSGNVYMGDWKGGTMCGKGTLTWVTGDSFTGNWLNGLEHGQGILKWADGGFYIGTWSKGLKDGKGVFYPPGTKPPSYLWLRLGFSGAGYINEEVGSEHSRNLSRASSSDIVQFSMRRSRQRRASSSDHKESTGTFLRKSESLPMRSVALEKQRSMEGVIERVFGFDSGSLLGFSRDTILEDEDEPVGAFFSIVEREYAQGVLISEFIKDNSLTLSKSERRRQRRQVKEIKRPGETIIKGHRSYDLMLNLQLGIRYTVGKISPEQRQEIGNSDFAHKSRILVRFPREGSQLTPPHQSVDFTWKDYCPMVFRNLRQMFKIDAADYMMSICGNDALRELSSPGKSRCIFFLSNDDRFMIKTLRKPEVKVLLRMLPSYYIHVHKHENTLITKFFGLHRVKPLGGRKVRFVVMGNMFYTELRIHRRFDIKGSLQGRSTDKIEIDETTTLKDLDLDFVFYLEPTWREALLKQIEVDCDFLESQRIMDYSLLLGLHFRAPQFPKFCSKNAVDEGASSDANGIVMDEDWTYPRGLVLVAHEPKEKTLQGPHVRGKPLKAGATGHEEVDLLLPGAARLMIQLGVNMPARADRTTESEDSGMTYDVVLYLGIIDILQEYNIVKKIEHTYKSLQFDSVSISAVDPHLYSQRFQDCIRKIFPPNPC